MIDKYGFILVFRSFMYRQNTYFITVIKTYNIYLTMKMKSYMKILIEVSLHEMTRASMIRIVYLQTCLLTLLKNDFSIVGLFNDVCLLISMFCYVNIAEKESPVYRFKLGLRLITFDWIHMIIVLSTCKQVRFLHGFDDITIVSKYKM